MKCPNCHKKMNRGTDTLDGVRYETFRCVCGEELMDMQQLGRLARKFKKFREAKEVTFSKWGNSIGVRIPKEIVEEYNISSGSHGILTKDKEGIRITPL